MTRIWFLTRITRVCARGSGAPVGAHDDDEVGAQRHAPAHVLGAHKHLQPAPPPNTRALAHSNVSPPLSPGRSTGASRRAYACAPRSSAPSLPPPPASPGLTGPASRTGMRHSPAPCPPPAPPRHFNSRQTPHATIVQATTRPRPHPHNPRGRKKGKGEGKGAGKGEGRAGGGPARRRSQRGPPPPPGPPAAHPPAAAATTPTPTSQSSPSRTSGGGGGGGVSMCVCGFTGRRPSWSMATP